MSRGTGDGEVSCAAADEARAWTEVFTLFQQSGRDDRGAAFAMSMGSLRRKGEELDKQIEALRFAEGRLLQHARHEAQSAAKPTAGDADVSETSQAWGRALASSLSAKVRQAALGSELPWQAAILADEAHSEALRLLASQQKEQATSQVEAEAAQGKRGAVSRAEREALRAIGLNSKKLPLRQGLPPCGYFMRCGQCKNGKSCIWDHPEPELNSQGYPLRQGRQRCAPYWRTQSCKFGTLCTYDHPEPTSPPEERPGTLLLALEKGAARQHQLQLLLHLQLLQELESLKDPEALMNAWVRFRITFSTNG